MRTVQVMDLAALTSPRGVWQGPVLHVYVRINGFFNTAITMLAGSHALEDKGGSCGTYPRSTGLVEANWSVCVSVCLHVPAYRLCLSAAVDTRGLVAAG